MYYRIPYIQEYVVTRIIIANSPEEALDTSAEAYNSPSCTPIPETEKEYQVIEIPNPGPLRTSNSNFEF